MARLPVPVRLAPFAMMRLGRRLARLSFYNVLPVGEEVFFTFDRQVGVLRAGAARPLDGLVRPVRVLRGGVAVTPEREVFFGEYFDNRERQEVRIYRWRPGTGEVRVAHTFPPGAVRHVHCVRWDPVAGRLLIATGDVGDECRLLSATTDFSEIAVLGMGGEAYRAISPLPGAEAIWYGTDAQFRPNRLLRLDRCGGGPQPLAEVNGPVYYAAEFAGLRLFATTAELCPSQTSPEAVIHAVGTDGRVCEIARWRKDVLPGRLFQHGIIGFPVVAPGVSPAMLPFSGTALEGLDGRVMMLRPRRDAAAQPAMRGPPRPAERPGGSGGR